MNFIIFWELIVLDSSYVKFSTINKLEIIKKEINNLNPVGIFRIFFTTITTIPKRLRRTLFFRFRFRASLEIVPVGITF